MSGATGSVSVSDVIGGNIFISLTLKGLDPSKGPYSWRVHERAVPLATPTRSACSVEAVGAVFNPEKVPTSATCATGQPATCKVGDLSGIYGTLPPAARPGSCPEGAECIAALDSYSIIKRTGPNNLFGRAFVVSDSSSNPV
eukprot:UC1_evm1s816